MFFTRYQIFLISKLICACLPLGMILGIAMISNCNVIVYILLCFAGFNFLFFLYKCASWEFTYERLRVAYLVILTFVVVKRLLSKGFSDSFTSFDWSIAAVSILFSLLITYNNYRILRASKKPQEVLELRFPFQNGKYMVTDGGDGAASALMNYHYKSSIHNKNNTQKSMRYAVDIVRLDSWNRSVKNLRCSENTDYVIFHNKIVSPIDGEVVTVKNETENNSPFPGPGKLPYNLGNYVVIKKEDYYVIMGHMEKGSIVVHEGDFINAGTEIGIIGNSGLTPRPHLHMHVSKCIDGDYWFAQGVPLNFNGTFYPVKNKIIKV